MALANGTLVAVLLAMTALATVQFGDIAKLVSVVSDGSEVLMHLSHALDARVPLLESYEKGYAEGSDPGARARFTALMEDLDAHTQKATTLAGDNEEVKPLRAATSKLREVSVRMRDLGTLPEDERDVAVIEAEEGLSDALESLATAKLLANKGMEQRLARVKHEITRPVRLFWAASLLGVVIGIAISVFMRRRVSSPISSLSGGV